MTLASPLVAGDAVEAATRATYGAWLDHALTVIDGIITAPRQQCDWPAPPTAGGSAVPTRFRAEPVSSAAVEAARAAGWLVSDGLPPTGHDGALHGVTVAVKDLIDVAGLPTRNGTPGALWRHPVDSSAAWTTLAAAGAVCVGKAATHEMAWGVVTPQIANPVDAERIAGGSSGGSAACVAAHAATIALGTDTGGSIRIPAALCGVVGVRPTTHAIDLTGITPLAPSQDALGILAADVRAAVGTLELLLGRSVTGPADAASLRIGVLADPGRLQPAVAHAYERTLSALRTLGATIVACDSTLFRQASSVSLATMLYESAREHAAAVHRDPHGFGSEARALLTVGEQLAPRAGTIDDARHRIGWQTAALFERLDAFITPTTPCTAPLRGAEQVVIDGRQQPIPSALTRFTAWAPVAALPAFSVPMTHDRLPAGVQIMAPPQREDVCAGLALIIERLLA